MKIENSITVTNQNTTAKISPSEKTTKQKNSIAAN